MASNDRIASNLIYWLGVGFILGCISTAVVGCSPEVDTSPICREGEVGASIAPIINGVPSQDRRGSVLVRGKGYCSGTIIGPHTVLTAGHCRGMTHVGVEFEGGFQYFNIAGELAHPDYNGNVRNDVRLLYFGEALPEPYVELADDPLVCKQLVAQGYGIGSPFGELHERNVETVARYDEVIITTEAICNGDSGGGLYALRADGSYLLVGVNSFGLGEAGICDGPVGYANLLVLGEWVKENTI